jgi:hypothetical protein
MSSGGQSPPTLDAIAVASARIADAQRVGIAARSLVELGR